MGGWYIGASLAARCVSALARHWYFTTTCLADNTYVLAKVNQVFEHGYVTSVR